MTTVMPSTDRFLQNMIVIEAASAAARDLQNANYAIEILRKNEIVGGGADPARVTLACQRWLSRYARPVELLFGFRNGLLQGVEVDGEDAGHALAASRTITEGLRRALNREFQDNS